MAKILRGKRKGENIEIHQFSNDWIMDTNSKIHNPTSLEFTDEEIKRIKADKHTGMLFNIFELKGNRFKRRKR
jgi:hypothetical protein